MATGIVIPPWLRGPSENLGSIYASAFHTGASVANERARLNMAAQQAAVTAAREQEQLAEQARYHQQALQQEAALKQATLQQGMLKAQQELEVRKAYQQAQIGLRDAQLKQAQQKIDQTAKMAAGKFAAQQNFAQQMQEGASVEDALFANPELLTPGNVGTVLRSRQAQKQYGEPTVADVPGVAGAKMVYRPGSPGVHVVQGQRQDPLAVKRLQLEASRRIPSMMAQLQDMATNPETGPGTEPYKAAEAALKNMQDMAKGLSTTQQQPVQEEFDMNRPQVREATRSGLPEPAAPATQAAPWAEGSIVQRKDGSLWTYRGGKLWPYEDPGATEPMTPDEGGIEPPPMDEEEE